MAWSRGGRQRSRGQLQHGGFDVVLALGGRLYEKVAESRRGERPPGYKLASGSREIRGLGVDQLLFKANRGKV
jgi:hypothetical protein